MTNANEAVLRPMLEDDLDQVLEWRNREGVRNNMYTNHVITREEHEAWWRKQSQMPESRLCVAVVDGIDVGVVTFTHYTGEGGLATWAFYAGDTQLRGVGNMMECAALEYAFTQLKVRKLECEVLDFNMPVVKLHMRYGFRVEGILREAYQREGQLHDVFKLALLERDWRKYTREMIKSGKAGRLGVTGKSISRDVIISEEMIDNFASASGDRNPVHFDANFAKEMGFSSVIAHGMLTGSLFSELFAKQFPGEGTVYLSQSLEFVKPVPVGAKVTVRAKVVSQFGRRLLFECECSFEEAICLRGVAEVLAPKSFVGAEG